MNSLTSKEQALKNYIDNLITLNAKVDLDGTLLLVNETAAQLVNIPSEQLVGQKFWDTPWWNYDSILVNRLKKSVARAASGQTIYFEAKNLIAGGKYIYIDFTLNPVLNENNHVIYLVAEGRDITQRKLIEQELIAANEELTASNEELLTIEEELRIINEELLQSHQELFNTLESITDAFCSVNHRWEITYINKEAEKLLHRNRESLIGKNLWQQFPQVVDSLFYNNLLKVMHEQSTMHFEYFFRSVEKWFNIHAYPVPQGLSIYFHNITEYKLAEEKLALQNRYLTTLHETALGLMNRLDLDELLKDIVSRAATLLKTNHGWIYLVNNNQTEIVLRLGIGLFKDVIGFRMGLGEGLAGKVWQTGEPMVTEDYETWTGKSAQFNFVKIHAGIAAPLKSGSEVIGVIGINFLEKTRKIHPDEIKLITGFAQLASLALDNARLYNAAQQELTERKRIEEILRYLAYHDSLTDLPNRSLFNDRLSIALSQAQRHSNKLAVLFLDLDYFKQVNDTLGHDMGDQFLKGIANRLSSLLRKGDTIARIGGDEFTILLQSINRTEDAGKVAQKIIDTMKEPWTLGNHEFHITTSIGIAIYPSDGENIESLLKNADAAMYQAKMMGRNNFQYYTPAMNAMALQRLELETNLRRALDRDEFIIYYQPLVEITTARINGMEALIRWQHPQWGLISPNDFIPLAEDTGLIVLLGEWVLRTACAQNKAWQDAGYPPMRINVNLSSRQFQQTNLVQRIATILQDTQLNPKWLGLEITESVAMKDVEFTGKMLFELRKMGITIAIDDFGTGYSSLSYLKRLPIDMIKIDRSFIRDISQDSDDASIVSTIIGLAQNLKMRVTAEGVETREQLRFLQEHHCHEMQGYLFSRPLPIGELDSLLAKERL